MNYKVLDHNNLTTDSLLSHFESPFSTTLLHVHSPLPHSIISILYCFSTHSDPHICASLLIVTEYPSLLLFATIAVAEIGSVAPLSPGPVQVSISVSVSPPLSSIESCGLCIAAWMEGDDEPGGREDRHVHRDWNSGRHS